MKTGASICTSELGTADYGARYQALTADFGDHGLFVNLCDPAGVFDAFAQIGPFVLQD